MPPTRGCVFFFNHSPGPSLIDTLVSNPDLDNSLQKLNSRVILEYVELTVKTKSEKYKKSASSLNKYTQAGMHKQTPAYTYMKECHNIFHYVHLQLKNISDFLPIVLLLLSFS